MYPGLHGHLDIETEIELKEEDFLVKRLCPSKRLLAIARGQVTPGLPGNAQFPPEDPLVEIESISDGYHEFNGALKEEALCRIAEALLFQHEDNES